MLYDQYENFADVMKFPNGRRIDTTW